MRMLLAAFVMVSFAAPAFADDWADCTQGTDPDRSIRGCGAIIAAGRESPANLAIAYFDRGLAYLFKGIHDVASSEYDKARSNQDLAIADFDKAIELNPQFAEAYSSRGSAYGQRIDFKREIADENEAVRLKPDFGSAYYNRALAFTAIGDVPKGLSDFRTAARLIPAGNQRHDDALAFIAKLEAAPAVVTAAPAPQAAPAVVAAAPAPQPTVGSRVALIIGNGAYQNVAQLTNPTNDAKLIAAALKQDGFGVTLANDLDHAGLVKALRAFANEADTADWAVVYFAGHGIEMAGTNYLIPVDAKLLTDRDVDFEAVPIGQVLSAIDGAHVLRLVILDACRNNPFAATLKRTAGEGRDIGRGLARIEPARGTEVVYSAKEGTIAADGDGADSPFATALAQHLTEPGIEVDKLFRLVRDDVLDATGNRQEPFVYGSLPGRQDFYFRPQ